jgi:Replication-relaxation
MHLQPVQEALGYQPMPKTQSRSHSPLVLSGVLDKILKEAVYPYHLLTAKQITRLLYPTEKLGMHTTIKNRLKQLTDAKYLTAAHLPTADGVRPFVYYLGLQGRKLLKEEGYTIDTFFEKADLQTRSYGWFMHLLETNNFLIQAAILEKAVPSIHLFDWQHDFTIAANPILTTDPKGERVEIKPDGFLDFRYTFGKEAEPRTRRFCFLVELDRGTESDEKFRRKIRYYLIAHEQEKLTPHFHTKQLTIIFPTTAGARRVEKMRQLTRRELGDSKEDSYRNQMFKFTAIPPLMQLPQDSKTLFCTPLWLLSYGTQEAALIDLEQ